MEYKNLQIYNAAQLIPCEGGGVTWRRLPAQVHAALSEAGKRMNGCSTGVELRFVQKSDEAALTLQSLSGPGTTTTFQIYYGGLQGGWECHEENTYVSPQQSRILLKRPRNMDTLRTMTRQAGLDWDPAVVRIIFNRGAYRIVDVEGDICPPAPSQTPQRTLLTYGSSITHGSNALSTPNTWPSLLAHRLNMDLRNLGMAGSCAMEPETADYIAAEGEAGRWDMAVLELGINVLGWEEAMIRERVKNTVAQIAGRNPGKPVFVISPFYSFDDFSR